MPYTLMKGLVWVVLAVLLGIVVGWLLRSVAAKRQVERARAANLGNVDQQELERLRHRVANLEPAVDERDRLKAELDAERQRASSSPAAGAAHVARAEPATPPPVAPVAANADEAATVLGKRIEMDDLTVIEGIGPKIAELCHGIGIRTWAELSVTEVSLLRTMLTDAGQRFKAHDPGTWPRQAGLLATGAWAEFRAYTDELDGGRPVG
jgi:predicted flap endonuclease-1-like 5' DNA nuclease